MVLVDLTCSCSRRDALKAGCKRSAMTFFVNLATSGAKIGYSLVADALVLPVRPLAIIYAAWPLPMLEKVLYGGLFYGFLSTVSAALIGLSLATELQPCEMVGMVNDGQCNQRTNVTKKGALEDSPRFNPQDSPLQ